MPTGNGRRVAVVAGCRTAFCRAGSVLKYVRAMDLARYAARELLERTNLDGDEVDEVVWGQVVPSPLVPNVGREVSLLPQLPKEIPAYSLNRACASANQAVTNAHDQIALGHADIVLAGGVETLSDVPILVSRGLADILVDASKAKSLTARLGVLSRIRPRHLVPVTPAIAEPSTGMSMGQSAEKMAKENGISREAQDRWALRSHQRAAQGTSDGRLTAEIVPWFPSREGDPIITADNGIRTDTSLEQMAQVKAVPLALQRAGIQWKELGLIEIHEAFAAQVLSNLKGFEEELGWEIDEEIINVMGGSIAIGHPFGATGGRLVTTLANEMRRRDVQFGLISVCAQGGMASAVVLERR